MSALASLELLNSVPLKSADFITALVRIAWVKLASLNTPPERSARLKSVVTKVAFVKFASVRTVPFMTEPFMSTDEKLALAKIHLFKSAPTKVAKDPLESEKFESYMEAELKLAKVNLVELPFKSTFVHAAEEKSVHRPLVRSTPHSFALGKVLKPNMAMGRARVLTKLSEDSK